MKNFFSIVLLAFFVSGCSAQSKIEKVWNKVEAINQAVFVNKDSAALAGLLSEKVTYGHSGGNIEDKHEMIKGAVTNAEVYNNLTSKKISAITAGNTIVVRYSLHASAVKNGNTNPLNLGIIQVWGKEKGDWKLFARQAVKLNPK